MMDECYKSTDRYKRKTHTDTTDACCFADALLLPVHRPPAIPPVRRVRHPDTSVSRLTPPATTIPSRPPSSNCARLRRVHPSAHEVSSANRCPANLLIFRRRRHYPSAPVHERFVLGINYTTVLSRYLPPPPFHSHLPLDVFEELPGKGYAGRAAGI